MASKTTARKPTETPSSAPKSKADLVRELIEVLTKEVAVLEETHRETRASATHEEAKPENDKDTRALEQSYLARGQALRIQELRESIARVRSAGIADVPTDSATLGSLVVVQDDGDDVQRTFLLMPAGGGTRLGEGTSLVLVVTPESPWGRALIGAKVGDGREVTIAGTLRDFEVLSLG